MIKVAFTNKKQPPTEVKNFESFWVEIIQFKELGDPQRNPFFIEIEDEEDGMMLITTYDQTRWIIEILIKEWGTTFGKIDKAGDFKVKEMILNEEELREIIRKIIEKKSIRAALKSNLM
ncbi:MAG: hypothetical protein QXH19_03700 [Candidatus Bathyarchaeia archaeon]